MRRHKLSIKAELYDFGKQFSYALFVGKVQERVGQLK